METRAQRRGCGRRRGRWVSVSAVPLPARRRKTSGFTSGRSSRGSPALASLIYWVLKRLNMLDKMKASHFVKKYSVQFVNQQRQAVGAVLLRDNKPHECSQTWQVLRSEFDQMMLDNAREHGVEVHQGRPRAGGAVRGRPGRRRAGAGRGRRANEVRAKVVVDASGQSTMLTDRFKLRQWDPVLKKGAIWTYWKGRTATPGGTKGPTLVIQTRDKKGWCWYIPLHDDIDQRRHRGAVRLPVQGPRHATSRSTSRKWTSCPASRSGSPTRKRAAGLLRHEGIHLPREAGGGRRLGAGRRRLRLPRPALLLRRAAGAEVGRVAADAIAEGLAKGDTSAAQLGKWGPTSTRAWTGCGGWCASTTTASASAGSSRSTRTCKGTVTDLLIGDLFNDQVDEVWGPMESLYPPDKKAIPTWDAVLPQDAPKTSERTILPTESCSGGVTVAGTITVNAFLGY